MKVSRKLCWIVAALCFVPPALAADKVETLATIEAEPKLEKRAGKALNYARKTVGRVVKAYRAGDPEKGEELLTEIQRAIELAKDSLDATGKEPFKKPKHFKNLEIGTRKLLGELGDIEQQLNYDERPHLNAVKERIAEINQALLTAIMKKKKKK